MSENTNIEANTHANGLKNGQPSLNGASTAMDPSYQPKTLNFSGEKVKAGTEFDTGASEIRLLVLYTGGTIGMKSVNGVYSPAPNYMVKELQKMPMFHDPSYTVNNIGDSHIKALVMPESKLGKRVIYQVLEYDPILDSCNMTMADWARLVTDIKSNYARFDGFVILHGTDTMSYTASALSFMCENLGKPIVLTGSQIPIFETRSDGRDNFLGALIVAGHYCIPEVSLYFNNKLLRGNRSTKIDSGSFDAFHSPNLAPLALMEIEVKVNWEAVFTPQSIEKFTIHTKMCPNVGILRLFPSITAQTVKSFLQPPMEGVVIQTYGAGNGPDARKDLLQLFKEAADRGVFIVNITQCPKGGVSVAYAAGKALADAGIISGSDMTPEAALTKMAYILGKEEWDKETKRKMIKSNLRGEMRVVHTLDTKKITLMDFPLLEKLKETMRLSSAEELQMLRDALVPSLMCFAARGGEVEALKKMKEAGGVFTKGDYDGRTALHVAASEGHLDIVHYLLENGSSVHARDRYGDTPLDDAVRFNQHAVIELLVKAGGHLNVTPFRLGTKLCE